ncbi:unnamed protein product [Tilletia controversa]|nr:unnamed protein product [Tilletia controversa]
MSSSGSMSSLQRLRIATSSVLGMTKGSTTFRQRLGWQSPASGTPTDEEGQARGLSTGVGVQPGAGTGTGDEDAAGRNEEGSASSGSGTPNTSANKRSQAAKEKEKAKAKAQAKAAGIPHCAAYPGAPEDLMDRLGYSSNKDTNPDVYPTLVSPETLTRTGVFEVRPHKHSLHRDPFGLWYEQHGKGDTKILFVMGLQSSCFSWLDSVVYYGKDPRYSCVVLDNRGFANSGAPYGRYRTSCMAWDCILLLDELGWTEQRSVHVVGVSMGGMITLELAKIAPERFASIMLVSTTSGQGGGEKSLLTALPPARGVATMGKLMGGGGFGMGGEAARARGVVEMLFPQKWLSEKHNSHPEGRTNREVMQEVVQWRAAFSRQAPFHGSASQIGAVLTHRVTNKELAKINETIPIITIMTGDEDNLVNPLNSEHLAQNMPRARLIKLEITGHAITIQRPEEIHKALDEDIEKSQERIKEESDQWIKSEAQLQRDEAEREAKAAKEEAEEADKLAEAAADASIGATEGELEILGRGQLP